MVLRAEGGLVCLLCGCPSADWLCGQCFKCRGPSSFQQKRKAGKPKWWSRGKVPSDAAVFECMLAYVGMYYFRELTTLCAAKKSVLLKLMRKVVWIKPTTGIGTLEKRCHKDTFILKSNWVKSIFDQCSFFYHYRPNVRKRMRL